MKQNTYFLKVIGQFREIIEKDLSLICGGEFSFDFKSFLDGIKISMITLALQITHNYFNRTNSLSGILILF